jgi:HTH-type transcriptional regulator, transcriptional repressor of NAD biosynthesis genes
VVVDRGGRNLHRAVYVQAPPAYQRAIRDFSGNVHHWPAALEADAGQPRVSRRSRGKSVTGRDSPEQRLNARVKRVAIVGAESTGKTTLAQNLAQHFHTVWVPEYGREYTEVTVGPDAVFGYQWKTEEFVHIARRQIELEDQLAEQANRVLICDTDALATAIWHERYLGSRSPEVEEIARGHSYDLYLLTGVDIPFVQDGIRDGEHLREWMTERFRQELERRHLPWFPLQGSYAERFRTAVTAIEKLIS